MNFFPIARGSAPAAALACLLCVLPGRADDFPEGGPPVGPVQQLPALTVAALPSLPDQYELPQTLQTVTADDIDDTINAADAEDALKYLPSLFVRKRNDGDNQAVLATRSWGLNSSARTLVYVDGIPISALIANNNTIGAPQWGMVAPEEIDRVTVLYGPYAAAYPGNSMGAVVEITTRMPDRFEASLSQTEAFQSFSLYSTRATYPLSETAVTVGDRVGKWSFWIAAQDEDSHTQPLTFVTAASLPAGTSGGILAWNKLGQPADVLGAAGIQDADLANAHLKLAYDFSPEVRATYTFGLWSDRTASTAQTYLRDAFGQPTFAGAAGFASGTYDWAEEHTMQSLSIRSSGADRWDWEVTGSLYDFDKDTQRSPATAAADGDGFGAAGKVALLGGTGWSTLDVKAAWYPDGRDRGQELSFGAHADEYALVNPTYNTPDWRSGAAWSSLATEGDGDTATEALWIQDAWRFAPDFKATLGARAEDWRAFDGVNASGGTTVVQPRESSANVSPKAALTWSGPDNWTASLLAGNAWRYPTAGELYQLVSTGTTYTSPNPDLRPEEVGSEELRIERRLAQGYARLSLFQEDVTDALVSQYDTLVPGSSADYQYVMNVGRIRSRGAEFVLDRKNALAPGLELSGSVTYADARIVSDAGRGQFSAAAGKRAPYVPVWRGAIVATYRPASGLAATLAGRYSGKQYSTVDNTDVNPDTFGGFDAFFVLDCHVDWDIGRRLTLSGGVDNLLDRKYFLYHPFAQRTAVVEAKCKF